MQYSSRSASKSGVVSKQLRGTVARTFWSANREGGNQSMAPNAARTGKPERASLRAAAYLSAAVNTRLGIVM